MTIASWLRVERLAAALVAGIMLCTALPARAHNVAADLSAWGAFGTDTARCQRRIARAAALCAARVLNARNQCLGAQLRGEECDTDEMNARVEAARTGASAQIQQACSSTDLQTLLLLDPIHDVDEQGWPRVAPERTGTA